MSPGDGILAGMNTPLWLSYVQVGAALVAIGLMWLGVRRGYEERLPSGLRIVDPLRIDMRLIWTGLGVWAASAIFGFATSFIWFGVLRVILSAVTLALTAGVAWMAWHFPERARQIAEEDALED